jgi:hypothetical protein
VGAHGQAHLQAYAWWREHPRGKIRRRGRLREHVREEDHNAVVELTRGA